MDDKTLHDLFADMAEIAEISAKRLQEVIDAQLHLAKRLREAVKGLESADKPRPNHAG